MTSLFVRANRSAVSWKDSHLGVQTVRRGGVGPVRSLLGGKPHRPLLSDSPFETFKEFCASVRNAGGESPEDSLTLRAARRTARLMGCSPAARTRYGNERRRAVTAGGAPPTTTTTTADAPACCRRFRAAGRKRWSSGAPPRSRHERAR